MSLLPDTGAVELRACSEYALTQLTEYNKRLDGRKLQEIRTPNFVKENVNDTKSDNVDSSRALFHSSLLSSVTFSDSYGNCVSCQVHGCFGAPLPHSPESGRLSVHVSSPFFSNNTNNNNNSSSSINNLTLMSSINPHHSTVYDGLKSDDTSLPFLQLEGYVSEVLQSTLNMTEWCVIPGIACWILHLNISLLNVDGSLRSTCLQTCVAALSQMHLPRSRLPNGDIVPEKVIRFAAIPVSCTIAYKKVYKQVNSNHNANNDSNNNNGTCIAAGVVKLIVDPTALEEYVADGILVITLNTRKELANLVQTGLQPVTPSILKNAILKCSKYVEQIHQQINKLTV